MFRRIYGLPPSDPRFLDLTDEEIALDLAMDKHLFRGGHRDVWFEEEAERDAAAGKDTTLTMDDIDTSQEAQESAMQRIQAALAGRTDLAGDMTVSSGFEED